MQLATFYVSQRGLRRPEQIPALVEAILDGDPIPPIRLSEDDDGSIQVEDGHHRAAAFWLAGKHELKPQDYLLHAVSDHPRRRLGTLQDFVFRNLPALSDFFSSNNSRPYHEHQPPQDQ